MLGPRRVATHSAVLSVGLSLNANPLVHCSGIIAHEKSRRIVAVRGCPLLRALEVPEAELAAGNFGFRRAGLVHREGGAPLRGEFGMGGVARHTMVLNVDMHALTDLEARRGDGAVDHSCIFDAG